MFGKKTFTNFAFFDPQEYIGQCIKLSVQMFSIYVDVLFVQQYS